MTPEEIKISFLKLLSEIAPEIDPQVIDPNESLRDQIDIDSLDFLHLIVRVHETFGMDIPESDYSKLTTLNKIVDYLAMKL